MLLVDLQFFAAPAVLCCSCMLASCAGPQIVKVSVYVPCVTGAPIVKPDFEFAKLGPAASDGDKVLALALAREWLRGKGRSFIV